MATPDVGSPVVNTRPLVEVDGVGGHVPYVRLDTTPDSSYSPADSAVLSLLTDMLALLRTIRDEARATRIGVETYLNEGSALQHDLLSMAYERSEEL